MIAPDTISELSGALDRLRSGAADAEIVQWLRAASPQAASITAPPANERRGYTRSLLHRAGAFEIVVIHWRPNCVTPVHDHGGALCWFAVAGGTMHVENFVRFDTGAQAGYAQIGLEGREDLGPGGIDYRKDDIHLHRCITRDEPATTLHLYARPIDRFNTFDEHLRTCMEVTSGYDAVL